MQETVTLVERKKNKKLNINPVISTVLFFLIIFLISAVLVVSKRSNLFFETRTFYVVYAQKDKNKSVLAEQQSKVKNLGGAAVLLEKNNEYYLAVAIYLTKDDANEVKKNLQSQFLSAGIVEFSALSVSNKYKNIIKKNDFHLQQFKQLNNFLSEYQEIMFLYAKGEISEGKFISTMLAKKIDIEQLKLKCEKENVSDLKLFDEYVGIFISQFDYLLTKFYSIDTKESLCFEFFINYCQTYIDFCKILN